MLVGGAPLPMNTSSGHALYDSMPDFDLVMMEAPVERFKNVKEKKTREHQKERSNTAKAEKAVNTRRR